MRRSGFGVLAAVAGLFGKHGVSIRSMEQQSLETSDGSTPVVAGSGGLARLIFITHDAKEADVRATLHEFRDLDAVLDVGSVLRVVGSD